MDLFEFAKKAARLEWPINDCTVVTRVEDPLEWGSNFCVMPAVRKDGNTLIFEPKRRCGIRAVSLRTLETPGMTPIKAAYSSRYNELLIVL